VTNTQPTTTDGIQIQEMPVSSANYVSLEQASRDPQRQNSLQRLAYSVGERWPERVETIC